MLTAIREEQPEARLAHLAYQGTMEPPGVVTPVDGVFLEFAPFFRTWEVSIASDDDRPAGPSPSRESRRASRRDDLRVSHADYRAALDANLAVFGAEDAHVLEYWLDVSLFSEWRRPGVGLPWEPGVLEQDLGYYASRGVRHVTSFGVYLDEAYFTAHPPAEGRVREFGAAAGGSASG